jgi:hypothetical protein
MMSTVTSAFAASITNQQATNTATNVTYSFTYSGITPYYRVYIDTDQNSATGYNANGIGANYMVENGTLFSHPANDSTWSWTNLGAVTFSSSGGVASWTVARSALGETANPNYANLIFQGESPLTTTAMYTHTYSGSGSSITNQQATNTATNVTYSFTYSGITPNYRVYIDTDQNIATGYNANGIGANYMVENGTLYSHPANNSVWSWTNLGAVTFSSSGGVASWTVARSALGETANPNYANLIFQGETPLTTTAMYTHTYSGSGTTVNYTASTAVITNPERGFDHTNGACQSNLYNQTTLQNYRTNENISLLVCVFYLTNFKTSPIDAPTLTTLQNQLNTIRAAGLKVILRFAYTQSTAGDDASLSRIQAHLDQLAPYFVANQDVIYLLQSGFVGAWGEGYYTQNFGNAGVISPTDWANRKAVVDKELAVLPASRMIQLRTPLYKTSMYGSTTVTAGTAFNGSAIARVGHHNDAFLADATDWGTYTNTAVDYPYLQAETTYLPMGGEPEYGDPTRAQCSTALSEMAMFHWSYSNVDYNPTTISGWSSGGCLTTMKKNLGYRFVLTQGTYPNTATAGGPLNVQISVRNDGYAALFNTRNVKLILRKTTSPFTVYSFTLTSDPRFWLAGTTTNINQTVTLTGVPAGSYKLLLNLPDSNSGLSTRPEYSIQLANTGTWESSTGFNDLLMTVTVQ